MITVREYIPGFVDVDRERFTADVESVADIAEIPWVKSRLRPGYHLCVESDRGKHCLMQESEAKDVWWVIGFLRGYTGGLPAWMPPKPHSPG